MISDVVVKGNDEDTIIKKILIAIDESEHREKIIKYGLTLAKSLGADVTVTHVGGVTIHIRFETIIILIDCFNLYQNQV